MKLWEILPQLKEGQTINVVYKDGRQDTFAYEEGSLRRVANSGLMTLHRENIEADYELIPQFIPFEEALKAYKEGKRICCESEGYGRQYFTIGDSVCRLWDIKREILEGKWWVVE